MTDTYPAKYKNAPLDELLDPAAFYNRECTSYCAWKVYEYTGRWLTQTQESNAKNWGAMLQRNGYKPVSKPSGSGKFVGILPDSGPYGHVYWWEGGNTVSQYNWSNPPTGLYSTMQVDLNEAIWYQITKPTTNQGGKEVITTKDTSILRAVLKFIKGWNAKNVDSGKYDASEMAAWKGHEWTEYLNAGIKEGKTFQVNVLAALAYYSEKANIDKQVAELKLSEKTLMSQNKTLQAQAKADAETLAANQKEIADLEKQLSEKPNTAPVDEKAVVENWFVKLWNSLFRR